MKRFAALMLMTCATWPLVFAQTADEVIDRYYENSGGKDLFRAVRTLKSAGVIRSPQGDAPLEIFQKSPDKLYVTVDVMGQKIVAQAHDGSVAWSNNPYAGSTAPLKLPASDAAVLKEESDIGGPFMDYASKGYTASYEGTGLQNGQPCHIIRLEKQLEGVDFILNAYFDEETYLPVMLSRLAGSGQYAGQLIENYYSNYRDTGAGLIMPFGIETHIGGQSVQRVVIQSIAVNEDIPDELFAFPGE